MDPLRILLQPFPGHYLDLIQGHPEQPLLHILVLCRKGRPCAQPRALTAPSGPCASSLPVSLFSQQPELVQCDAVSILCALYLFNDTRTNSKLSGRTFTTASLSPE